MDLIIIGSIAFIAFFFYWILIGLIRVRLIDVDAT